MADLGSKSSNQGVKKKKNKRKLTSPDVNERPSKTNRIDFAQKAEEPMKLDRNHEKGHPWRNLQLILSIQNKQLDIQQKVELALDFVKSRGKGDVTDQEFETVKLSRLIVFLSDWIQSLMISSEKKIKFDGGKPLSEIIGTCLDFRCWEIFKFCLEDSLKLHVPLSLSRNLLRAISCITRSILALLSDASVISKESLFVGERLELYNVVTDCVSLVFSSHGGLLNENLDLWIATADAVLELLHRIYNENLDSSNAGTLILQLSCMMLDPFAKFLRVHPTRKNGFHDLVDKLLEPLLHLLGVLHLKVEGSNHVWTSNLLKLVEDVFCQGLFHPAHIDGFLSLHNTEKYVTSRDRKSETVIKSYHRHLFDKLERITAKKVLALSGIGRLFYLLVHRIKMQNRAQVLSEGTKEMGKTGGSGHLEDNFSGLMPKMFGGRGHLLPENTSCARSLNAETRKSLFEFFVQIMEPLLLEMNDHLQTKLETGPVLSTVHFTLKSINSILAIFMHEKVYERTEDISEGACLNFLKTIYDMIMALSTKLLKLSKYDTTSGTHLEMFTLLAKEILVAIGYLLEIEYEIVGNDLVGIWFMMLSYLAIGHCLVDDPVRCSLYSEAVDLGCLLVNLYSELRQVNNTVFALCKAVRLIISEDGDAEMNYSRFMPCRTSLSFEAYAKSVGTLLCSQEFKLSINNAIKSIPEGQANGCIRELKVDVSESLEWMKMSYSVANTKELDKQNVGSCFVGLDLQAELLGRGLSEVYALVLDSLTATMGNSTLIGVSVKDLMTVISPCMSSLVGLQPASVNEFLFSATGRSFDNVVIGNKSDILKFGVSTHWIFVFFFRLYMSCRSLYRQAISLMPPDTSRKMSARMGDSFTSYSGRDRTELTDWIDEGYFSLIVLTSVPLLVVIQSVSDIYLQEWVASCGPLIYVLHAMAIQRLVDLNKQINSLEYLLQSKVHTELIDNVDCSMSCKKGKNWERKISILKQEAVGLTEFMMGFLSSMNNCQQSLSTTDDASSKNTRSQSLHESDEWDLGVCAVDESSLPAAIWWVLCQNTDIWCFHAAKKKLKLFLSILISTSLPSVRSNLEEVGMLNIIEPGQLKKVTVQRISLRLLSDSIFYEQRFVRRHLASRFCRTLEKSALTVFCGSCHGDVNFNSLPNWSEVLSALEKPSLFNELPTDICKERKELSLSRMKFTACHSLLSLLCWVPKVYISSRSLSLYATHILNLERFAVCALLDRQATLNLHSHNELIRLFISCRKALKYLLMDFCEDKVEANQSSYLSVFFENSSLVLWLLKSVSMVVGIRQEFSEAGSIHVKDMLFSLMDHTSYVFLTLSKCEFSHAVLSSMYNERPGEDQLNPGVANQQCYSIDAWNHVFLVAESLKEQTRNLFISLKDSLCSEKEKLGSRVVDLSKLSSLASCFNGFLWGISSSFNQNDAEGNYDRANIVIQKWEHFSELKLCINTFVDFVNFFLHMLLVEDEHKLRNLYDAQTLPNLNGNNDLLDVQEFSIKGAGVEIDTSGSTQQQIPLVTTIFSESSSNHDDSKDARIKKRKSHLYDANRVVSALAMEGSLEPPCINKPLLKSLLKGDNPEASFFLRQLLIAASAILRLNFHINLIPSFSNLVPIFTGISQVLLLELAEMNEVPQQFSFVWLDGVLKYLEELGSHFPLTNPTLSRNVYAKLVDLHLKTIGKCIALQGKRATLAAHQTESSTKMLHGRVGLSEASSSHRPYCLDEFISRLRMSFKVLIRKPVELHILSAVQTIERALVGVQEGCSAIYEINTGSANGGMVSPIVAAGIDCLDLVLEFVSGRRRLSVVKRHIQSLIAGLFNIILHLQNPVIFYGRLTHIEGGNDPDPGSVILMCVEVLTRVSGKHALFQMESWHVSQALRIPAALFQDFYQLRLSIAPVLLNFVMASDNQVNDPVAREKSCVDRKFTIDLYAACCRLLCTVLKHHKSESESSVALLEDSVCVLLRCLKTVNTDVKKEDFAWEIQEGVKCACFLRRIYEEIRQQKDVFGRHCFKFLSSYIWVYSGYGPLKTGIRREVDEALRPGVYALVDACSADDLQYLHTVFGEGPRRNTLSALQHDYELNFQYEGKV